MISTSNHVSQAARSSLNSRLTAVLSMAGKTLESTDQLAHLNINLARATLEQSNIAVRQLVAAKDLQKFCSLWSAQLQPNAWRLFDYCYYLSAILAAAQIELMKLVNDSVIDLDRKVISMMRNPSMNARGFFKAEAGYWSAVIDSAGMGRPQARSRMIRIASYPSSERHIDVGVERPAHAPKKTGGTAGKL